MTPRKFREPLADKLFNFSINYLVSCDKGNNNRILAVKSKLLGFARSDNALL